VVRRTPLARDYERGELTAPGPEKHLALVVEALRRLPGRTVVMRLTTDTQPGMLAAPRFFWDKALFYRRVRHRMESRGVRQGDLFEGSTRL
jgi:radical SAM superfamily enzyme